MAGSEIEKICAASITDEGDKVAGGGLGRGWRGLAPPPVHPFKVVSYVYVYVEARIRCTTFCKTRYLWELSAMLYCLCHRYILHEVGGPCLVIWIWHTCTCTFKEYAIWLILLWTKFTPTGEWPGRTWWLKRIGSPYPHACWS